MAKKGRLIQTFVVITIIAVIFLSVRGDGLLDFNASGDSLAIGDWGYSTAYEGVKAYFYGMKDDGKYYNSVGWWDASLHRFDTYLRWDSDSYSSGKPNIMGEETSVFLPEQTMSNVKSWIPNSWIDDHQYTQNPIATYEPWTINGKTFSMEKWVMRYYVTMNVEFDGSEKMENGGILYGTNIYQDAEVWIRLDLAPIQYFTGMERCFFAIAEVEVAQPAEFRDILDGSYSEEPIRDGLSVHPYSEGSNVMLYYEPWGVGAQVENDPYDYQGVELNPQFFTDELFMHLDLNNFGLKSWKDLGIWEHVKCDSVTWAFDVSVFAIGEWKVQDIDEIPELYGRLTQSYSDIFELFSGITDFFTSPMGLIILLIIGGVLLLVFAPQVLFAFAGGIGSRGGKKGGGIWNILTILVLVVVYFLFLHPWVMRTFF